MTDAGGWVHEGGSSTVRVHQGSPGSAPGGLAMPPAAPDPRVVRPRGPVTVLLTSGREVHAANILQTGEPDDDDPLIVEDGAGYVYVIAPDEISVLIVEPALASAVLP